MEIVMGSAYLGWMEDFGLIGVFCSLGSAEELSAYDFAAFIPSVYISI
jgi:hypothetical protein